MSGRGRAAAAGSAGCGFSRPCLAFPGRLRKTVIRSFQTVTTDSPLRGTGCRAGQRVMADCDAVTTSPIQTATATLHTNRGDIKIALFGNHAPKTVANFVGLAQGGDPSGTGRGGPGYKFADEFHPELQFDKPYLLAMANAGPGTNGSQFFITVGQTPHLNRRHTIFGEVVDTDSQKVVDTIAATDTDHGDRPTEPVVIESITIS